MRPQSRRFVVELKRGTNRAAFASADPNADRFRDAEATLFGGAPKSRPVDEAPQTAKQATPGGRILRSLVEPPPPTFDEMFPPVRRGRKPGSKNKPKPETLAADPAAERPRRGRKPGSKNRPKAAPPVEAFLSGADAAAAARGSGMAVEPAMEAPTPAPANLPAPAAEAPARGRTRLRERSSVLRRYVLDAEARPGQPGSVRARRLARAAR